MLHALQASKWWLCLCTYRCPMLQNQDCHPTVSSKASGMHSTEFQQACYGFQWTLNGFSKDLQWVFNVFSMELTWMCIDSPWIFYRSLIGFRWIFNGTWLNIGEDVETYTRMHRFHYLPHFPNHARRFIFSIVFRTYQTPHKTPFLVHGFRRISNFHLIYDGLPMDVHCMFDAFSQNFPWTANKL